MAAAAARPIGVPAPAPAAANNNFIVPAMEDNFSAAAAASKLSGARPHFYQQQQQTFELSVSQTHREHVERRFPHLTWFTFAEFGRQQLYEDPFFWSSWLLQLGWLGFLITAFVSLMQVEQSIAKGWVLWIFYLVELAVLIVHTFVYAFYARFQKSWLDLSPQHMGRIRMSLYVMWIAAIFSIAGLSSYIYRFAPPCCNGDVPGLTTPPISLPVFVIWYTFIACFFFLQVASFGFNAVSIYSLYVPERRITRAELERFTRNSGAVFFPYSKYRLGEAAAALQPKQN
jgi:hypothetical protein